MSKDIAKRSYQRNNQTSYLGYADHQMGGIQASESGRTTGAMQVVEQEEALSKRIRSEV